MTRTTPNPIISYTIRMLRPRHAWLLAFAMAVVATGFVTAANDGTSATRQAATYPAPINPEDVPMATSADIWVGILTVPAVPPGSPKDAKLAPSLAQGVFAYVVNISDHPIRLYTPGLVGPNFGVPKGSNVEGLSQDTYSRARFKAGDYVILNPGEQFGRRAPGKIGGELARNVGAHYLIYPPDRIGHWSEVAEVVYPGGYVDKVKR